MQRARKTKPPEGATRATAANPVAPVKTAETLSLLPRLAADIFCRMTDAEKLQFLRLVGAELLEEWLATLELMDDPEACAALKRAQADIEAGREREVPL